MCALTCPAAITFRLSTSLFFNFRPCQNSEVADQSRQHEDEAEAVREAVASSPLKSKKILVGV